MAKLTKSHPKRKSLAEYARIHTKEAVDTIVEIMRDVGAKPGERLSAATALLDRGYGRPTQAVSANLNVTQMSDEELKEKLPDALKRAEEMGLLPETVDAKEFLDE